jgi:Secretion system C-terminal sorting domain
MRRILTTLVILLAFNVSNAQVTEDLTVELSATTQVSPPRITLHWKLLTTGTPTYLIYKKAKSATFWGSPIATITTAIDSYADNAVIVDSAYEYQVLATGTLAVPYPLGNPSGYMYAGIKCPAIHNRGILILIVDSTFTDSCAVEIKRLMRDISGDGWQIIRHDFPRTTTDAAIKAVIANDYATHTNVKSVLLLGHVAVPYSGDLNPDGHPDHLGAWPADVYYGVLSGSWSDALVNDAGAGYVANHNIPGDGKWDQTPLPAPTQLQVSRVDFYDMPAFSTTEIQRMRSYLNKDHVYKMDSLTMRHRGVLHDDFGYFSGEGFAANSWRNFAPLVNKDSISVVGSGALISTLAASTYQWAYGCGGGNFSGAGGIGSTTDFAANPVNGIFTMLFGSYFGDWNVTNNFLRAPLSSSNPALTCCWAGRPNWFFHHMALGDNIGYSAMLTQNNDGTLYQPGNSGANWVHIALQGDLTLRTDYIKPITSLVITKPYHSGAILNWTASPDPAVIGYYVYRADSLYGYYQRLNASMLTTTTYHDLLAGSNGLKYYMVRPVKLQSTPSGNYYNLGVGVYDTATVSFSTTAIAAVSQPSVNLTLFPNPAQNYLNVIVNTEAPEVVTMYVVNEMGQTFSIVTKELQSGDNKYSLNISAFAPGMYTLVVRNGENSVVKKWVKNP